MLPALGRRPDDENALDRIASTATSPEPLWAAIDQNPSWHGTPRLTASLALLMVLDAQDLAQSLTAQIRERTPETAQAVADQVRAMDTTYLEEPELASTVLAYLDA